MEIQNSEGDKSIAVAEVPPEAETPIISLSRNLAATINIRNCPPSIMQNTVSPSISQDREPAKARVDIPATTISSPTLSFSTVSDLTPTEFGEIEQSEEQAVSPHDTFYFDDGNVEIVCGDTLF